ncbi:hypothetical protein [Halostella litorea]|uniref:hypothetical protein n=1 Tax=Halostella litorea TaxID=2528831 RepID=UPI00109307BD|nr:hypothetical protein [Halostella litorea]
MVENKTINVLTLWFVVATFLRTSSGSADNPLLTGFSYLALVLLWAIPVYFLGLLFVAIGSDD